MQTYIILALSILSEVFGTTMLKATKGFKKMMPIVGVILGYGGAFYGISLTLRTLPLGTTYAIWSGVGTALTSLAGIFIFKEKFHFKKGVGILFIIVGIILLNRS